MPAPAHPLAPETDELTRLCHEHLDYVWRCLRMLGVPEAELEDAAQDVFVAVIRTHERFERRASVKTWLFRYVYNVVRTRRRATARHNAKLRRFEITHADPLDCDPMAASDNWRDATTLLRDLIQQLDDDKRNLYVLVEIERVSVAEIAKETGINVNTLYTRLRAARKQMEAAVARHQAKRERRTR